MSQVHLSAGSPCVSRVSRSPPELLLYQSSAPLRTDDPALAAWKALTHHLTPQVSSLPCKWKTLCALNPARACVPDFTTVLLPRVAHLPNAHSPLGRGTPPKAPVCTDSQLPCRKSRQNRVGPCLGKCQKMKDKDYDQHAVRFSELVLEFIFRSVWYTFSLIYFLRILFIS